MMTKFDHVAVLGAGAFGVALSRLVAKKAQSVSLWGRDETVCRRINETRHHPTRLPHVTLAHNITALSDPVIAVRDADCVIFAVPMAALRTTLELTKPVMKPDAVVVSTAKGIEEDTLLLPCQVITNVLPTSRAHRACYLSGPSFAVELAMDLPTALTLASLDQHAATLVQNGLSSTNCRIYRTDDVVGVSVGGALKNVIAIAAGACTALGLGRNALAALITRGLAEMARLTHAVNGKAATLSGLSGAGDLILSCTDDMSRNHRLGTLLADGWGLTEALTQIGSVVEGAKTAKAVPELVRRHSIEMPISQAVYEVLYQGVSAKTAISSLLMRSLKDERW